jgi:exosortase
MGRASSGGPSHWGAVVFGAAFLLVYSRILIALAGDWQTSDDYSHGLIVAPAAVWLAWNRRGDLRAAPAAPSIWGLGLIVASLLVLLIGTAGVELFLTRVSAVGVLVGGIAYLGGWRHVRLLAFPLGILLLTIPLPSLVFNQIAFPLQLAASRFGVDMIRLADVPVLREGNVIVLANTTLEVAEACSGIRSLISLLAVALFYGYFTETHQGRRALIALSAIPVAVATNAIRVAATGVAAHYYGPQVTTGFLHGLSGWLVFLVSFALIVAIARATRLWPAARPLKTAASAPVAV